MKIDWETFQKSYLDAPQVTRDLVDSGRIFECISKELDSLGISITIPPLVLEISYNLLGIKNTVDTSSTLNTLGITSADAFISHINECLSQKTISAPLVRTDNEESGAQVMESEKTSETLHNIRTMSADMNVLRPQAEVVHTASSQADILARPPIAPSNTPVNSPRWDSDK